MVAFEFIWQESHTFCFLSIFFLFVCAVIVKKINENPKAIFPSDLEKLHSHWPEPDKGYYWVFCIIFFLIFLKHFSFLIFL